MADFAGFISTQTLVDQVRSAAPWLFGKGFHAVAPSVADDAPLASLAEGDWGWLAIVRGGERLADTARPSPAQRCDYFALCLACHHASVASYVPTDVDTKIRGHCWQDPDPQVLASQWRTTVAMRGWHLRRISARWVDWQGATISGHDGEWLGTAVGAVGGFLAAGDTATAAIAMTAVRDELEREAAGFASAVAAMRERAFDEVEVLRLAAIVTHNVGDVDQGLSHWSERARAHPDGTAFRALVARLAHENATPFAGAFHLGARLYRRLLAAEGHRHYPLRAVRCLRRSPDLLLPIGPFFDAWGATLASHEQLSDGDRGEIVAALIGGCRKIDGQVGYYRALAGLAGEGGLERFGKHLMGAAKQMLKDPEIRRHCQTSREAWESSLRKQCRNLTA